MLPIYLPKYERKQKKTHTHNSSTCICARANIDFCVVQCYDFMYNFNCHAWNRAIKIKYRFLPVESGMHPHTPEMGKYLNTPHKSHVNTHTDTHTHTYTQKHSLSLCRLYNVFNYVPKNPLPINRRWYLTIRPGDNQQAPFIVESEFICWNKRAETGKTSCRNQHIIIAHTYPDGDNFLYWESKPITKEVTVLLEFVDANWCLTKKHCKIDHIIILEFTLNSSAFQAPFHPKIHTNHPLPSLQLTNQTQTHIHTLV